MSFPKSLLGVILSLTVLSGCPTRNPTDTGGLDTGSVDGGGGGFDVPLPDAPGSCTTGPENTALACADGCDNDTNTFTDCNEFDCCSVRSDCPVGTACGDMVAGTFTIAQLQDRSASGHPASGDRVSIDQAGMVALTPRVLVGSATGGSSMSCRFAIWVGAAVSGEFTAIQVQELIPLTTGITSCFDLPVGRISDQFEPGDAVTEIRDATYSEFCAGPTPAPTPCTSFEQSNVFLGGTATIVRGAPGTAPSPTVAPLADLAGAGGTAGARAVALEGSLLTVEGIQIGTRMDGSFAVYYAFLPSAPTVQLDIIVSNFPATSCVRDAFATYAAGSTTHAVSGVLLPNFGRWSLRIRDEADVNGLTCP